MRTLDIDKLNIPEEIKEQYKHWVSVADDLLNVVADNTSVPYKRYEYTNQLVKALNRKYKNKLAFYVEEELEIYRVYNGRATELHRLLESSNPGVLIENRKDWDKVFNLCKVCQFDSQWWDNTYCAMYWYDKKNKLKFPILFPSDMYEE